MKIDLAILWRYKITLAICTIAGIAVGVGYLMYVPTTYQGQARVLVKPQGVAPEAELLGRVDPEFLPTQAETIRSPITIHRALQSMTLTPPPGADVEDFDPVRHVLGSLKVMPILKANVVTIGYRSNHPEETLTVITNIIEAYRRHVAELDKGQLAENTQVVAARERSLRADLEKAQKAYAKLRRTSPWLGQGRDANAQALMELKKLGDQLAEVRRQRTELTAKLDSVKAIINGMNSVLRWSGWQMTAKGAGRQDQVTKVELSSPRASEVIKSVMRYAEPADARALQDLEDRLRFAKARVTQLDEIYGPRHPGLIEARSDVADLENAVRSRLTDIVQGWQRQWEITEATAKVLAKAYKEEQDEVKAAESYLIEEEFLKGNLTRLDGLHSATLAQLVKMQSTEHALAGGRTSIEVRVLEAPALLNEMTWPKPKLLLPAAACLGFLGGFCLVLLLEFQKGTGSSQQSAASQVSKNTSASPRHEGNGAETAPPRSEPETGEAT